MKTIKKIKVRNMRSSQGNSVPNQFIIDTPEGTYFQSYSSIVIAIINGKVYLDKGCWDYSTTTGAYRNIFLRETKKETEKKIKSGVYKLADLN